MLIKSTYLLSDAKNIQISIAKNVKIITYETSTRNISFIAGFDNTANKTRVEFERGKKKKQNWKKGEKH